MTFKINGIDEFQHKLDTIKKKAPGRIAERLDESGNILRKEARSNTPRKTGKLRNGFRLEPVEKVGGNYQKGMRNTAPHYHLVEKGHRKVSRYTGKDLGWTEGLFMLEKTVIGLDSELAKQHQEWLETLFEELN